MSKVRACWIELIDCWIPYSGIRKKKEINSAILVFFRHFQNEILTFAKTSGTE